MMILLKNLSKTKACPNHHFQILCTRKKFPLVALFYFLEVLSLTICNYSSAKSVKISVLTEVPEVVKDMNAIQSVPAAAQIALESRKAKLKDAGIEIQFDYKQNNMDALKIYETMKNVFDSDAIAAVGFRSSAGVEYSSKVIENTNFVAIAPFASSTKSYELKPNYLMLVASNKEIARHLENFSVNELGAKKIAAIVAWDAPYSRDFYENFSESFKSRIKLYKTWESLDGFEKEIQNIKKFDPDTIILPNFPVASASIIRMLSNAGVKTKFIGADSWGEGEDGAMYKILKNVNFTGYTIRQFSIYNLTEKQIEFKKMLKNRFNFEYSSVTGLYHDSILHIIDLILSTKNDLSRNSLFYASKKDETIDGVMGKNCLSTYECKGRTFTILKFTNQGYTIQRLIK